MKSMMARRVLACLVSVVMVVGLTPMPAYAGSSESETAAPIVVKPLTVGLSAQDAAPTANVSIVYVNSWSGLQSAVNNAKSNQVIQLAGDVVNKDGKDRIKVQGKGNSVTIDLAGYTLDRHLSKLTDSGLP